MWSFYINFNHVTCKTINENPAINALILNGILIASGPQMDDTISCLPKTRVQKKPEKSGI